MSRNDRYEPLRYIVQYRDGERPTFRSIAAFTDYDLAIDHARTCADANADPRAVYALLERDELGVFTVVYQSNWS